MKRIIEFRGKSTYTGEYVYGSLVNSGRDELCYDILPNGAGCMDEIETVYQETIGERTPFNATDGTQLFEGMTVRAVATPEHITETVIGKIEMNRQGMFVVNISEEQDSVVGLSLGWGGWKSIEILED